MGILTAGGFAGFMFFLWLIGPISQVMTLTKGVFVVLLLSSGLHTFCYIF